MAKLTNEQRARLLGRMEIAGLGGSLADDCWVWQGSTTGQGYANATVGGKTVYVQKVFFEDLYGELKAGHRLFNTCGRRTCVRPAHWEARPWG